MSIHVLLDVKCPVQSVLGLNKLVQSVRCAPTGDLCTGHSDRRYWRHHGRRRQPHSAPEHARGADAPHAGVQLSADALKVHMLFLVRGNSQGHFRTVSTSQFTSWRSKDCAERL